MNCNPLRRVRLGRKRIGSYVAVGRIHAPSLQPMSPHIFEGDNKRDKFVQRCRICDKGRVNKIHRV